MSLRVKKGDILLFSNGGMIPKLTVQAGQKLLGLGRGLDSSLIHAGIVTKGGDAASSAWIFPDIKVTHAIGTGICEQRLDLILKTGYQFAMIFRPSPALASVAAKQAAAIAQRWAQPGQQHPPMRFSRRKAFMAGFGSSNYGAQAQSRAAEYHQYKDTNGGPPSLHASQNRNKSMYCSMFVVAVYQAALGPQQTTVHMNIDARNCTPMKLADFVRQKGFVREGNVFYMNSSFHVVDSSGTDIPGAVPSWA